jgi:prevent-host-death family protein
MQTVRIGAEQFRRELTEVLARVSEHDEQVIVEQQGAPQVVVISYTLFQQFAEQIYQRIKPQLTEDEFERLMIQKGIILPRETAATTLLTDDWEPVPIQGKPVSEIILEERR